ncbi:MAG TPA: hypothetical protein VJ302_17080 [Blastocatellia bacterium]|nr:hypothetical protein [Blastocatellia bacterium]
MGKIGMIIGFEYLSRVRRRSFILTTIFTPFLILLPIILSSGLTILGLSKIRIAVLDQSGVPGLFESIKQKSRGAVRYDFSYVPVPPDQNLDQVRLRFNSELENGSGRAYLVFRAGILDGVPPEFYTGGGSDFGLEALVRNITLAVIDQRLAKAGLDAERYLKPVGRPKSIAWEF